jgi:uncharacterized phage-associated protein
MLRYHPDGEKVVNMIAYFATRCPQATKMKISKLMYYADKTHLNLYGRPISGDAYIRMKFGPVPSMGLNLMRHTAYFEDVSELFDQKIEVKGVAVRPLQEFDRNVFSRSDMAIMDRILDELGERTAGDLSDLSHGEAAWNKAEMNRKIDFELLFDATPESQHMLGLLVQENQSAPERSGRMGQIAAAR